MPNSLTATGLTTATQAELIANFTTAFEAIYGSGITLTPDSPDGQAIGIFVQSVLDLEDLLTQIYSSFDPDNAVGTTLDQRVAINGIQRQGGTYTVTPVTLTCVGSFTLYGLDQTAQPVYTVADNAGNQWELISSVINPTTGAYNFQAANIGAVTTIPNTITIPVTVVLGVTAINNPSTYTVLGINQESDAALKIRRQISVTLASQGYLAGLLAALENINGLSFAYVEENTGSTTNGDGVPAHSIWVIVAGTGAAASIANAIYTKRNAGCGMYNSGDSGAQSYVITQVDGSPFIVYWDDVVSVQIFVKFTVTSLDGINAPNIAAVRSGLVTSFTPGVAAEVNINQLATLVQKIDPNSLVTVPGFCLTVGGSYTNTLTPSVKNKQFAITSANTIILPMILTCPGAVIAYNGASTLTIVHATSATFSTLGGYGTDHSAISPHITYSIVTSTGGSIVSATGVYTAGTAGTDVITATDNLSNIATCTVTVT